MDKYTLLILLNTPFVIYGIMRAVSVYKKGRIKTTGLLVRIGFWLLVLSALWFASDIYGFLVVRGLTDSTPLSIADVVLATSVNICLFMILRLYARLDAQQWQFTQLHEKLSIQLSERRPK